MRSNAKNTMMGIGAAAAAGTAAAMLWKKSKKKNPKQIITQAAKTLSDMAETVVGMMN